MTLYTITSLAKKTNATPREIDYWTTNGFIKPTPVEGEGNQPKPGTGKTRIWAEHEAEIVLWFARLVRNGMKPSKIGATAERLAAGQSAYLPGGIEIRRTPTNGDPS